MKKLMLFVPFLCMVSVAVGDVSTRVCLADGNTPVEPPDANFPHMYGDFMVGTKLTIIVDSNVAESWSGSLAIADANMDYGVLSCRDFNEVSPDCEHSHLPPAGIGAQVLPWEEAGIRGYDLYTGSRNIEAGDWFIIDYTAIGVGTCHVGFYDHDVNWVDPIYHLSFSHVRTRDFNDDTIVDFADFAVLASYWRETSCSDPNWCEGTDLDEDRDVDAHDLTLFADYWLEETDKQCHNLGFK